MLHKVRIYLRGGANFPIICESAKATTTGGNTLTSYEITGIIQNSPLYLSITDIQAIVDEGLVDHNINEQREEKTENE